LADCFPADQPAFQFQDADCAGFLDIQVHDSIFRPKFRFTVRFETVNLTPQLPENQQPNPPCQEMFYPCIWEHDFSRG
jgi:hypothetical protein